MRLHLFITGKVQGVYYRESLRRQADEFRVAGWVRNLPDGRVEAVLEGNAFAVQHVLEWCRDGPPAAQVRHVDAVPEPDEGLQTFEVRR